MDFDTVCLRNMAGDCFDMFDSGKPVFRAYQCHITIPTKLTIPPRTKNLYFSKYTIIYHTYSICPCSVVVLCRPHDHGVVVSRPIANNDSVKRVITSNNNVYYQSFIGPPYSSNIRTPSWLLATLCILIKFQVGLRLYVFDASI